MYSVIVSFGVIVSFRFSVFIVKGIFGVHATLIFGERNLEYQVEQFIKSGGQSVKILLSGKTGVGKSHLTNALIGEELAQEGEDVDPQTDEVS